jgi:hypothetical protein
MRTHEKAKRPSIRGSIPAVVGLAAVLAALGASAVFMTNGMNRLDRRADLSRKAGWIASSAAEEVILALMNGSAQWMTPKQGEKNVKVTYPAPATAMMYGSTGALVDPVKILARRLEEPQGRSRTTTSASLEVRWRAKFYGMLSAGPRFARYHDEDWEQKIQGDANLKKLIAPPVGITPDKAARDAMIAQIPGLKPGEKLAEKMSALNDYTANLKAMAKGLDEVGEAIADAGTGASCGNLAPDVGILTALGGLAFGKDIAGGNRVQVVDGQVTVDGPARGKVGEVGIEQPEVASGSDAAPPDGGVDVIGRGDDFFETFTVSAEKAGILKKDKYLITLEALATVEGSSMEIEVPHVTHRVFARLHYGEAMLYSYGRLLAYISHHFGIPYVEYEKAGMVTKEGQIVPEKIMPSLEAIYSARPGPQAWPFPVATSILRSSE